MHMHHCLATLPGTTEEGRVLLQAVQGMHTHSCSAEAGPHPSEDLESQAKEMATLPIGQVRPRAIQEAVRTGPG